MSDAQTPTPPSDESESVGISAKSDSDIVIDITNGKHIQFNLDPVEWVIVLSGFALIIWVFGHSGLV